MQKEFFLSNLHGRCYGGLAITNPKGVRRFESQETSNIRSTSKRNVILKKKLGVYLNNAVFVKLNKNRKILLSLFEVIFQS